MNLAFAQRGRSRPGCAVLFCLALALAAGPARGDAVVATDGPGDIIAVVRGPEREMTVWRKGKVAGIWVNAEAVTFTNVPSFYAVAASRKLEDVVSPGPAALYRIGT